MLDDSNPSAEAVAMDEEALGHAPGLVTFVKGATSLDPVKFIQGTLSLIGVESNYSVLERACAREYEDWVFDTLLSLKSGQEHAQSEQAKSGARLDEQESRQQRLNWIIEEFERRLGDVEARLGDLMTLIQSGYEVWKTNMQPKKREYLAAILKNAFSVEQYRDGQISEFLSTLRALNARQIELLKSIEASGGRCPSAPAVSQRHIDLSRLAEVNLLYTSGNSSSVNSYHLTEFGTAFVRCLKVPGP